VGGIASASSVEHRHPGEAILAEGAPPGDAYIIWEGRAQISQHGRPRRVAGAGELIGEIATLHGRPRSQSAVALDDAVLLRLPRDELLAALAPTE
jgi:CPA1 family monovalent cation:H+ antiporter